MRAFGKRFFAATPFTDHAFLFALEQSQCVSAVTGWQPYHLAVYENDTLVAALKGKDSYLAKSMSASLSIQLTKGI